MCGICGLVSRSPTVEVEAVARAQQALQHRGPDGAGRYQAPHVALAMRRLSIIDLAGGWQPLYNEDRSLALVANGEIYNFVELRRHLESRGHRFRTGSDCETIVHLYEEHGPDCVHHLRGMFAFALWDNPRQRLLLARDRMGEKPLYLFQRPGSVLFASELKALLRSGQVPFALDPAAVDLYFHYHYVPEPATPLQGVRKLPPAHLLTIDIDPWRVEESCYWRMEDAPPLAGDPAELIRAELERVSELVIRSDVPVGVALSGGLDSSAIAILAARSYPGTMHAFSIGYEGRPPNDERAEALALAEHLHMPFHEVELSGSEMAASFPQVIYWQDDPIADIAGYGYYMVMKLARQHNVPVMLQGQGGDELFWGYPWLRRSIEENTRKSQGWPGLPAYLQVEKPLTLRPGHLRRWLANGLGLKPGWEHFQRHRAAPADRLIFYDLSPNFQLARRRLGRLYTPAFIERLNGASGPYHLFTIPPPRPSLAVLITRLICQTYLLENGIAQGDRLSMASGIELRLPLVDYRLVETVIGLRKHRPDHELPPKAWFKAAIEDILPRWVRSRPKRGFTPPTHRWLQALGQAQGAALADGYLVEQGVLRPARAAALGASLAAADSLAFGWLVLELWSRKLSALPRESKVNHAGS